VSAAPRKKTTRRRSGRPRPSSVVAASAGAGPKARPRARVKPKPRPKARPTAGAALPPTALEVARGAAGAGARGAGAACLAGGRLAGRGLAWTLRRAEVQRALAVGLAVASLVLASGTVRAEVERWPRFTLDRSALDVGELPPELAPAARQDVARVAAPEPASVFDPDLVPAIASGLEALPWVRMVEEVRVVPPNRVAFCLVARRPVARLGAGPSAPLVGEDGGLLPRRYGADPAGLPILSGLADPTSPVLRRRGLAAALEVLERLEADDGLEVAAVDVANLDGRQDPLAPEVAVRTRAGFEVEWGRPSDAEAPSLAPDAKVAHLRAFLTEGPDPATVARLSLRWDEATYTLRPAE